MPDNYKTNVVADLEGLNEVYKVSKERVDRIVGGTTAVGYAEKIGSTSVEGTVSPTTIGDRNNPVYVDSGEIKTVLDSSNNLSLGKSDTTEVKLGNGTSSNVTEVKSGKFTSKGDIESISGDIKVGLNDNNGGNITARETIKGKRLESYAPNGEDDITSGVFIGGKYISQGSEITKGVTLKYDNTLHALTFDFIPSSN